MNLEPGHRAGCGQYPAHRLEPALDGLLAAARAEGALRATVTARDLVLVIALMCQPVRGEGISLNERMIQIFPEAFDMIEPILVPR